MASFISDGFSSFMIRESYFPFSHHKHTNFIAIYFPIKENLPQINILTFDTSE